MKTRVTRFIKCIIIILFIVSNNTTAQVVNNKDTLKQDSIVHIKFNWNLEKQIRNQANLTYASSNICSRWIKYSNQQFLKLKKIKW